MGYLKFFSFITLIILATIALNGCSRIKGVRVFTTEEPRSFYFKKRNSNSEIVHGTKKEILELITESVNSRGQWRLKKDSTGRMLLTFTEGDRSFTHILLIKEGKASITYYSSQNYGYNGKTMSYKYWLNMNSLMRQAILMYQGKFEGGAAGRVNSLIKKSK